MVQRRDDVVEDPHGIDRSARADASAVVAGRPTHVGQPYGGIARQTAPSDDRCTGAAALGPGLRRVGEPEEPGR